MGVGSTGVSNMVFFGLLLLFFGLSFRYPLLEIFLPTPLTVW